ncbi:MAG: hypothetical protein ACT4NU_13635 [Chromatiales bacterium]
MPHRSYPLRGRVVIALALAAGAACTAVPDPGEPPPPITATANLTAGPGFRVRVADFIDLPTPTRFSICHGNTCAERATLSLAAEEWAQVRALFSPPSPAPAEERVAIAAAVGLLERLVGAKTGTAADLAMGVPGFGKPGQLDCIDEATNTTVYLTLLYNDGLLRWHTVGGRATRGPFTGLLTGWPHSTSVIRDNESRTEYAVDSWFGASGEPPYVVPIGLWWRGWRPESARR